MVEPQRRNSLDVESPGDYELFQRNRQELSRLTARLITAVAQLGIESRAKALTLLRERLESDRFKVMVLGEFKRGKSTFINALLGEEVLPSSAVPCTAVINEIKWAEERRAVLHFRHPLSAGVTARVPRMVGDHIQRSGGGPVPPLEVQIEHLEDYVAIPEPEKDQADSIAESPYARVEVYWPLELCRNGVEIIDSPGLNENATRARVTKDYVANVDAILFVMSCSALAAESELRVIDSDLRGVGHEYLFFICNRFDEVRPSERQRLMEYGRRKLMERTELRENGVFFLSALRALEGRLDGDAARLESSGMIELERALTHFLTHGRGKVKLLQPARELVHALDEARHKILPGQRAMLDESLAALENKVEQMQPRLEDAERAKRRIVSTIQHHRTSLRSEVRLEFEKFLRGVADELEEWIGELELEKSIQLWSFHQKEQIEAVREEICAKIAARFETRTGEWRQTTLEPLIQSKLAAMQEAIELQMADFCVRVDEARSVFFQVELRVDDDDGARADGGSAAAILGGIWLQSPLLVAPGSRFELRSVAVGILAQVATGVLCGMLGIVNPVVVVALVLSGSALLTVLKTGTLTEKVQKEIGRALAEQFRADLGTTAHAVAAEIFGQTEGLARSAEEGLEREILILREQVDAILKDKKAGEVQVQAKKSLLAGSEEEMRDIDAAVKELIFAVAGR
jgi:GTPase SAR1 family protein